MELFLKGKKNSVFGTFFKFFYSFIRKFIIMIVFNNSGGGDHDSFFLSCQLITNIRKIYEILYFS